MRTAARTVARNWEGITDAEDAGQAIWVHLLERPNSIRVLLDMDRPARISALNMIGQQIGSEMRDTYEVYSGNYTYSTDQVRALLDDGAMLRGSEFDRPDSETLTEFIDVGLAVETLANSSSSYYATLFGRFVLDDPYTGDAERKRVQRAVEALTREMNRANLRRRMAYEDGPGSRRVISNERAFALANTDYMSEPGLGGR